MSFFYVFVGAILLLQVNGRILDKDSTVLHPNIKFITIGTEGESGDLKYESWTPSKEELEKSENEYLNFNYPALRLQTENEEAINHNLFQEETVNTTKTDYINIARPLTYKRRNSAPVDAVVEVLVVCDKEFGDVFQHDRIKILDYLTVYFWDINLRYKTLPSDNVSFRITGVVVISSPAGQPFIEQSRAPDGRAEFGRILDRFKSWVYAEDVARRVPQFDIAVAITNTALEWGGGLAHGGGACGSDSRAKVHWGTLVFNDAGNWGSLTVGAHEIGHVVGAPHDDDSNFPGGCQERGYIMGGGNDDLRWFFSICSNRLISQFVRSDQAACLRRIDYPGLPPISTDFSFILAPTMTEQCRRHLQNPASFVQDGDTGNCKQMKCLTPISGGHRINLIPPVDNTPCLGGGRCFRGRCRPLGSRIKNVGTGQCMRPTNPFVHTSIVDLVNCPMPGTPLDRFIVTDDQYGKTLATPFATVDAKENMDKCVYTGNGEGGSLYTDRCVIGQSTNGWHGWDFISVGNNEFLIQHRITKRCAKAEGNSIRAYSGCNSNDRNMRWVLQ